MSRSSGRHRKTSHHPPASHSHQRRKRSRVAALQHKPVRIAAAVAGSTLIVSGASPTMIGTLHHLPGVNQADEITLPGLGASLGERVSQLPGAGPLTASRAVTIAPPAGASRVQARRLRSASRHQRARQKAAPAPAYRNPVRDVSGLIPERIDMGVDFGGSGPVYALGDAVVTGATADSAGWPGGGWITYRLTDGPDAGKMVFLAEDVTPTVQAGQHVTSGTVIAHMCDCGDGIETGWAMPDGSSAESQLPEAGGISGAGPFPTEIGLNFEEMLQAVGVPAANNRSASPSGTLPSGYPTSW
jgi:murein DD-endopeptidase MepM/ murein hydrolase activator NlpD